MADDCWPMKLALGEGVPVLSDRAVSCTLFVLVTPASVVLLLRLRSPFGDRVIDRFSLAGDEVEVDAPSLRSVGDTT